MAETGEANQVNQAASSLWFPVLEFGIVANGTYPNEDLQGILAWIAFDNEFVNAGVKPTKSIAVTNYELARSNPPTGRTSVLLVVVPHRFREDVHFCLVTPRDVTSNVAQPLAGAYRRRWGSKRPPAK